MCTRNFAFDLQLLADDGQQGSGDNVPEKHRVKLGDSFQLNFDEDSEGLFEVSYENRKTGENTGVVIKGEISAQKKPVTLVAPQTGKKYYIRASVRIGEDNVASLNTYVYVIAVDSLGEITYIRPWEENGCNYSDSGEVRIQAPNRPVKYWREGFFNIRLENVAAGSEIGQLNDGDYVSTAELKAGDTINISGRGDAYGMQSYTAAASGKLVFKGEHLVAGTKMGIGVATLFSGVVKVSGVDADGSFNKVITTGTDDDSADDDTIFINQSADEVTVKVKRGKVVSIVGMTTEGGSVIVMEKNGSAERYTCLNNEGTNFKKEIGTMEDGEFVLDDNAILYHMKYDMPGYNIYGDADDYVDVVTVECPPTGDTVTTQDLSAGDIVQLALDEGCGDDVRCYIAGADGRMTFVGEAFVEDGKTEKSMALVDGTVMLSAMQGKGYSRVICAGRAGDEAADDVVVMNRSYDNVTVEVKDGQVTSIRGLAFNCDDKGEAGCVIVASNFESKNGKDTAYAVRYTCLNTAGTVIRKEEGIWDDNKMGFIPDSKKSAEYVRLDAQGDDLYDASYVKNLKDSKYGLSFDKNSEGIFEVSYSRTEDGLGIFGTVSGEGGTSITTPKSGKKYYVEACVTMENGMANLHINPWVISVNASGNITIIPYGMWEDWAGGESWQRFIIKAPSQKPIHYVKDVPADLIVENVAAGSLIEGIHGQDIITTAEFKVGDTINIMPDSNSKDKFTYVAGAAGVLKFRGEFYLDANGRRVGIGVALQSGTVRLTSKGKNSKVACAGADEVSANDDIIVMNHSKDVVNVTVENGKVTSITGLESEAGGYVIVRENMKVDAKCVKTIVATRYSLVNDGEVTLLKKETGVYDEGKEKFILNAPTDVAYAQYTKGANIRGAGYAVVNLIKLGGLNLTREGTTEVYYSRNDDNVVEVTAATITADNTDNSLKGEVVTGADGKKYFKAVATEAYLRVTATTDKNLVSTLRVEVLRAKANGSFEADKNENHWSGTLNISGLKDANASSYKDKYAVLKFDKPKAYANVAHEGVPCNVIKVTNAALGSVFSGFGEYDYIETAATGDREVALTQGTYNIYHTIADGDKVTGHEIRTLTVIGEVAVKTSNEGRVTYLGKLSGENAKVTLKEKSVTTSYELNGANYIKTVTASNGAKKQYKVAITKYPENILEIGSEDWSLYNGSESISAGHESVKAGSSVITGVEGARLSVTAKSGVYAVGDVDSGETFEVNGKGYTRYGNFLFTEQGDTLRMYDMGKGKSIEGGKLDPGQKEWKTAAKASVQYGKASVNISAFSAVINANKAVENFSVVTDKYVVKGKTDKNKLRTSKAVTQAGGYHDVVGAVTAHRTYNAGDAGQNIVAADGWTVNGGAGNDTITSAATPKPTKKNKKPAVATDIINAGGGNNIIKLGTAKDTVIIGNGNRDTITGYASSDRLMTAEAWKKGNLHFQVDGSNLYITNAKGNAKTAAHNVLLKGVAKGKAVNIDGERHYFASEGYVSVKKGKKTIKHRATTTITGSKYDDIIHCSSNKDTFITGRNQGKDKVLGFGVGDVIKLNNLNPKDISALKGASAAGLKKLLAGGFTFTNGGSLTVSTKATLRYNAKTKQITAK